MPPVTEAELRRHFEEFDWYHTQELMPGVTTPGMFDLRPYVPKYGIPDDLTGKRVLEVGTFEGFWAFELERRGAQVTAIDVGSIQSLDWARVRRPSEDGKRGRGFELAARAHGSAVERREISVYDATPESLGGPFDLVFCGSVLIHLRDPVLALERMADLCAGRLILAEEYSRRLRFVPGGGAEFHGHGHHMTWWRPTVRVWRQMLFCAGFEDIRVHRKVNLKFRVASGGVPHVVLHALGPEGSSE